MMNQIVNALLILSCLLYFVGSFTFNRRHKVLARNDWFYKVIFGFVIAYALVVPQDIFIAVIISLIALNRAITLSHLKVESLLKKPTSSVHQV